MAVRKPAWRPRPVTLTPLIDIIFLLLLFFMLGSTFTRFAEVPLVNAGAGTTGEANPVFLQLRQDDLSLNGTAMSMDTLVPAVRGLIQDDGAVLLVTLADDVTSQRLIDLLTALRPVPNLSVSVLE